jgi:hypothetical protein
MSPSPDGQATIAAVLVSLALIAGIGVSVSPLSRRKVLVLAGCGPFVALIIFLAADPEGGCSYDCGGRFAWGAVTALGVLGWLVGIGAGLLARSIGGARSR